MPSSSSRHHSSRSGRKSNSSNKSPSSSSSHHHHSSKRRHHRHQTPDSPSSPDSSSSSPSHGTPMNHHLLNRLHELISIASTYYSLDFSQTPLLKPLLLLTGSQSAGKSAIINYLYSFSLRRVGEQAVDEKFSLIECVSEKEFEELARGSQRSTAMPSVGGGTAIATAKSQSGSNGRRRSGKNFSFQNAKDMHWLMRPRHDNSTDDREGIVWCQLSQIQTMQRYKQFYENSELGDILRSHNLLEAIVVNEKYVRSTELCPDDKPIARDVIVIDSPGINDESIGSLNKFRAYIRVLEFFYKQAHKTFFVSDPSQLRSIGNALHMLELTIADSETKQKVFESVGAEIAQRNSSQLGGGGRSRSGSGSSTRSTGISFSLSNLIVDVASSALHRSMPYFSGKSDSSSSAAVTDASKERDFRYVGGSLYDKVYFIINKADKIRNLQYAFFEFGLSLGKNMRHFPLPHANRILAVALPMEQRFHMNRIGYSDNWEEEEKRFEKVFSSMKWNGKLDEEENIVVAQLGDLEAILAGLRGEHTKRQCLLFYIDFVYKSIHNARVEGDSHYIASTFRKLKHYYTEPWSQAQMIYREVLNGAEGAPLREEDGSGSDTE